MFINKQYGNMHEKWDKETRKHSEKRTKLTTESINNIKTLKFYGWTNFMTNEIQSLRDKEFTVQKSKFAYESLMMVVGVFFGRMLNSVVFGTYVGLGYKIDLAQAFRVMWLFGMIRHPLNRMTDMTKWYKEKNKAVKNIEKYFHLQEVPEENLVEHSTSKLE